jgi:hypothetical protein
VLAAQPVDEAKEAALAVLRYLPVRSANEVKYVVGLAEGATDTSVQNACARALRRANPPKGADAWDALEVCKQSGVKVVRDAVEEVLKRRW